MTEGTATVPPSLRRDPYGGGDAALWMRRIGIGLLLTLLAAGVVGVFGQRESTHSAEVSGLQLAATTTTVTRSGLPHRLSVQVRSVDGALPAQLDVHMPADWVALVDQHAIVPAPAAEWVSAEEVVWTFEPPAGARELIVVVDARFQVDAWGVHGGGVRILTDAGPGPSVDWTTWIWP